MLEAVFIWSGSENCSSKILASNAVQQFIFLIEALKRQGE